jgi:two-component system LytT family sensor kinase
MASAARLYWAAQFIGWLSYGILVFLAAYAETPEKINTSFVINVFSLVFLGMTSTHLMRNYFIRSQWIDVKLFPLIPKVLIASFICSVGIVFGTEMLSFLVYEQPFDILDVLLSVFAVLILVLFWNSIYFTYHFFQKSRQQELRNLSLEASRNEIELKNLLSQLNPHFLFNSLNSIRALIDIEPGKAKYAITTLSALLRKSLLFGKEELVSLSAELELVDHYLQLEKMRFEERLDIKWELDEGLNSILIPPFCIQALAENAIKHGVSRLMNGGAVTIRTHGDSEKLNIEVRNTGQLGPKTSSGIGIKNTKRRLDLIFRGSASLELTESGNEVIAKIEINR